MEKRDVVELAETICEVMVGGAIGIGLKKTILPKCTPMENIVVTLGGGVMSWMIGRTLYKELMEACGLNKTEHKEEPDMA